MIHRDAIFPEGIPNFLGNFTWGCQIPCDTSISQPAQIVPRQLRDPGFLLELIFTIMKVNHGIIEAFQVGKQRRDLSVSDHTFIQLQ